MTGAFIMNKKISVVMSTYNEPVEWVEKSIRSMLNQTYDNISNCYM